MLDTRKTGLIQSSPPSMSRNELYVSAAPVETKPAVRARDHRHVDPHALLGVVTHIENSEFGAPAAPVIVGQPRVLAADIVGTIDQLVNGGFDADTDWTKGTGWTIAGSVADSDGTQVADSDLTQLGATLVGPLLAGVLYTVNFNLNTYSAGNITAVVGDTEGPDRAASGFHTQDIVAGAGGDIDFRADVDFVGSISVATVFLTGNYRAGDTLRLSCGAVGTGLTYQWQVDGVDIVGATDAILTIPTLDATNSGVYTCDVTNATATTSSAGVTVIVV